MKRKILLAFAVTVLSCQQIIAQSVVPRQKPVKVEGVAIVKHIPRYYHYTIVKLFLRSKLVRLTQVNIFYAVIKKTICYKKTTMTELSF